MTKNNYSSVLNLSIILFIILFLLIKNSLCIDPKFKACEEPKSCGDDQKIKFPFYIQHQQEPFCGYPGFNLTCDSTNGHPTIKLSNNNYLTVQHIYYENQSVRVSHASIPTSGNTGCIPSIRNLSLPDERFRLLEDHRDLYLLYGCNGTVREIREMCGREEEKVGWFVDQRVSRGWNLSNLVRRMCRSEVAVVVSPVDGGGDGEVVGELLRRGFVMKWTASNCTICEESGGRCGFDEATYHFKCYCTDRPHAWRCNRGQTEKKDLAIKIGLGIGIGILGLFVVCSSFVMIRYYKRRNDDSNFQSRNMYSEPYSKPDLERDSLCLGLGAPVFSYRELEEATHNFDPTRELGDGGFGTVYHGKLRDGREVAVKRLYENNYRRVQQFINEVKILSSLRHKHLVSLYGCTSRHSRDLLVVYEFIPNGTVADHLHGERSDPTSLTLTWPLRLTIAIETATALAYLHASDIIHRDVKTNNILLDENFSVKVADFGLSRLFPNDVTHVSTTPQGTPGYVDPEYHQCYQLTTKSDVYSFGVMLIELISSMPAVDITRDKHEINLANFAVTKIGKHEYEELVDRRLGFSSDNEVRKMIIEVAQLAFQCLQQDKEGRPTMEEVVKRLKEIGSSKNGENSDKMEGNNCVELDSPECDEIGLLKSKSNMRHQPSSPISVTDKWISRTTSPSISG